MFRMTRRRLIVLYFMLIMIWAFFLVVMHGVVGGWSPIWIFFDSTRQLDRDELKRLMASSDLNQHNATLIHHPLLQLLAPGDNCLHFFNLPKRKTHIIYGEVTSANRDMHFPLAPDFTFHIEYSQRKVVLYESYGPACIFRIFLYPSLPTNAEVLNKMTSSNLSAMFLVMEMDDQPVQRFSLQKLAEASEWPFVQPLSVKHPSLVSGIGAYTPFCYRQSLRLIYESDHDFPENLLDLNVNCTANELRCPIHIYSAVSSHKFPAGTSIASSFGEETTTTTSDEDRMSRIVELLKSPEVNGPDAGVPCLLNCFELCSQCQRVLYHRIHSSAVITSLRMRVFMKATGFLSHDWTDVFFTAYFDNTTSPQFDRVPLGSLFGATASLNEFAGAAFGKRSMYCDYADPGVNLVGKTVTGYFHFPMPYWHEALIVVEGSDGLGAPVTVCFQITDAENFYEQSETGYLHGIKTYYRGNVDGWRSVLDITGGWGHVVSLSVEVDNLVPVQNVPLAYRWAALQADPIIHIDNSTSATVLGSGLEDYFSYAHGFAGAENTTYAFVGVHHGSGGSRSSFDPLTWHCYRQHVLDAITFRSGVHFFMEGTGSKFSSRADSLTYQEHRRLRSARLPTLAYVVFFYFRHTSAPRSMWCDQIWFGNATSEHHHKFELVRRGSDSGRIFTLADRLRRFIGDTSQNQTFSFAGCRAFTMGDMFRFELSLPASSAKLYRLRRTSYSKPRFWNDRARWSVNGIDQGVWFLPMGSLSEEYSLVNDDRVLLSRHLISGEQDSSVARARFEFQPISKMWNDISYELCVDSD